MGCGKQNKTSAYIKNLEIDNNISFTHVNNYGAYIPTMCYTKTEEKGKIYNPCYSCHTKGKIPNFFNDTILQKEYNFPKEMMKNPYTNLFKDKTKDVTLISDQEIITYVNQSNYLAQDGSIILAKSLPNNWPGYKPDCNFNFDEDGFDKDEYGEFTLWRAFRYYPFLGTFWPTNGAMDDVMIRLDKLFSLDNKQKFSQEIYALNLAIVEANVKQKDIPIKPVKEALYGVDFDGDGKLSQANNITYMHNDNNISYVGYAKQLLDKKKIYLVTGLFPLHTEFLHSVRYLGIDKNGTVTMANRMKELRYSKKISWKNYSQLRQLAKQELWDAEVTQNKSSQLKVYRGNFKHGFDNGIGWIYQGFIEDKRGVLRPQTDEETISCMGCHSMLGSTSDSTFSFTRKFEEVHRSQNDFVWNHWNQKNIIGIKDKEVSYKINGKSTKTVGEYAFYLEHSMGNEFRDNDEITKKFFDIEGLVKTAEIDKIAHDISYILIPSKERALRLNKAYKTIVQQQSFTAGKDTNTKYMDKVYEEIPSKSTHIISVITK